LIAAGLPAAATAQSVNDNKFRMLSSRSDFIAKDRLSRRLVRRLTFLASVIFPLTVVPSRAADLRPDNLQEWPAYVEAADARNQERALPGRTFLSIVDMSGLGKIRWLIHTSGYHEVRPLIKLADGTWLVGDHGDATTLDYHVVEVTLADLHWLIPTPEHAITRTEQPLSVQAGWNTPPDPTFAAAETPQVAPTASLSPPSAGAPSEIRRWSYGRESAFSDQSHSRTHA
jgi:hypothetical protein